MNDARTPEYRKLELDTSNEMIEYDSRWGLGRYAQAALHIREAGFGRLRMGQIMFDAGEFVHAAEDWLSAGECFYLGSDLERMRDCFERVRQLDHEGRIPAECRHIHAALKERKKQLRTLEAKLTRFRQDYGSALDPAGVRSQEVLDALLRQLRDLPGYPWLHWAISLQAASLGKDEIASQHSRWGWQFGPRIASNMVARLGYDMIAKGELEKAINLGQLYLASHPTTSPPVRFMLAEAFASNTSGHSPDLNGVIEVVRPVVEDAEVETKDRLLAIGLSAAFQFVLGHEDEHRRLLDAFDRQAATIQTVEERSIVDILRQTLPRIDANGATDATAERRHFLAEPNHTRLFRVAEQYSLRNAVPAA
jgi:hypothetical protein